MEIRKFACCCVRKNPIYVVSPITSLGLTACVLRDMRLSA
jgi:hypothetical protein